MLINPGAHRQIYATIAASMSIFISGMWLGWPSSAAEKLMKHRTAIQIDSDQLSWVVCLMDLGNVLSPLLTSHLMDRLGRRLIIAALGPLFLVSWLLALCVPHTWALYTARLMAGLGKGASYTVAPVFLGEIAGVNIRGALGSVFTIQLSAGFLFEVIVGPYVSYHTLNLVSATIPVLFFIMFMLVPESPYYLLKKDRRQEATECLRWYRCGSADDVGPELGRMEVNVVNDMKNRATFSELYTNRANFKALTVVMSACVAQRAGGVSCLIAYSALILPEPAPLFGKPLYIIISAAMLVVVNFVGLALVDRLGRKPLLIASEVGLAAVTFVFGLYYFLAACAPGLAAAVPWLPYACHFAFFVVYSVGIGFIPVVFLGEMFPVNIRSHCSAIASITLAFFSFVSNKTFLFVSDKYGMHVMFWSFAAVNLGCACFAHCYAIETNGKTFQEIQEQLQADSVRPVNNDGGDTVKMERREKRVGV